VLGAVFHVQYHGRNVHQAGCNVPARSDRLHPHHVAWLHELICQPSDLHYFQPRVPEGVQETHVHRHVRQNLSASWTSTDAQLNFSLSLCTFLACERGFRRRP
jgi:hypothetical protein